MESNYTWEDLKSYFKDNPQFPDAYERLLREEEREPRVKNETCADLSGLLFRVDWKNTAEGRPWWYQLYTQLMHEDDKIRGMKV